MDANKYNISMRTNDDFMLNVNVGYDISSAVPKFVVRGSTLVDWSGFITLSETPQEFIIYVKASEVDKLGQGTHQYDCVIDFGQGSKAFVLGGSITVARGIS